MRNLLQQGGPALPGPPYPPPLRPPPPPPDIQDQVKEQWLALLAYTGLGFAGALVALVIILCGCFASRNYFAARRLRRQQEGAAEEEDGNTADGPEATWIRAWHHDAEPPRRFRPIKIIERKGVVVQQPGPHEDSECVWVGIAPSLTSQDGDTPRSNASSRHKFESMELPRGAFDGGERAPSDRLSRRLSAAGGLVEMGSLPQGVSPTHPLASSPAGGSQSGDRHGQDTIRTRNGLDVERRSSAGL